MQTPSFLKKSVLSAMIFFGTLGVLSIGYATWTGMTGSVADGENFTSALWNSLVENVNDLDTRTNSLSGTLAATQAAVDLKANLISPTFSGAPLAPTQNNGTNDTTLATTAFVETRVASAASGGGSVFGLFYTSCPVGYTEYGKTVWVYANPTPTTSGCFASIGQSCNLGVFGTYVAGYDGNTNIWHIKLNGTSIWTAYYTAATTVVLCGK